MKHKIYILIGIFLLCIPIVMHANIRKYTPQNGDIIFQSSKSFQSTAIKIGTLSTYSHCGIIVIKNDKPYVLEAHKGVELTPLNKWINRGTFFHHYKIMRLKKPQALKINYTLGVPYDLDFKFDNGKYYCSELVWKIYNDNNICLCTPKQLKQYYFLNLSTLQKQIKKRNFNLNQYVVSPSDLIKSKKLKTVTFGFNIN